MDSPNPITSGETESSRSIRRGGGDKVDNGGQARYGEDAEMSITLRWELRVRGWVVDLDVDEITGGDDDRDKSGLSSGAD